MKDADDQIADSLIRLRLDVYWLIETCLIYRCPYGQSDSNAVQIRVNLDGLRAFCAANKGLWRHVYLEADGQDVVIRLTNRERAQKY